MAVVFLKKDAIMMHIVAEPVPEDMWADLGSVRVAVCVDRVMLKGWCQILWVDLQRAFILISLF